MEEGRAPKLELEEIQQKKNQASVSSSVIPCLLYLSVNSLACIFLLSFFGLGVNIGHASFVSLFWFNF